MSTTGIVESLTIPQLGLQHTLPGRNEFSVLPNDGCRAQDPEISPLVKQLAGQTTLWRVDVSALARERGDERQSRLTLHGPHVRSPDTPYRQPNVSGYRFLSHHRAPPTQQTEPLQHGSQQDPDAEAVSRQQYFPLTSHTDTPPTTKEPTFTLSTAPFFPITLLYGGYPDIPDGTPRPSDWALNEQIWRRALREHGISPARYHAAQYRGNVRYRPLSSRPHRIPALPIPEELPLEDRVLEFDFATAAAAQSSLPKHYELTAQGRARRYHSR